MAMKKTIVAFILVAAIVLVAFLFAGCTQEQRQQLIDNIKKMTVQKFTTETYEYNPFEGVDPSEITYTSSSNDVATVSSQGVITAINVGLAVITATYGSEEKSIFFISAAREINMTKTVGDTIDDACISSVFTEIYPAVIDYSKTTFETSGLVVEMQEDGSYEFVTAGETYINGYYEGSNIYAVLKIVVKDDNKNAN